MDPTNFKTYDELKEKLNRVISGTKSTETVENVDLPPKSDGKVKSTEQSAPSTSVGDKSEDNLDYFRKLAAE